MLFDAEHASGMAGRWHKAGKRRHLDAGTIRRKLPAVIGALQVPRTHPPQRQLGTAMGALIRPRVGGACVVAPEHYRLTE